MKAQDLEGVALTDAGGHTPARRRDRLMQTLKEYLKTNKISEGLSGRFFDAEALALEVDPTDKEDKNLATINSGLYGEGRIFTTDKPIFITERPIDALSIIEAGGEAVACGSDNPGKLLNYLYKAVRQEGKEAKHMLIIAFNPSEASMKNAEFLADNLKHNIGVGFQIADLCADHEDISTAFFVDKETFKKTIKQEEGKEYLKTSAADALVDFMGGIKASANTPAVSTGFKNLDSILDGGLYEGLYIIGAVSSLGKTTFALQIIDQLAQQGQDCLIFSLEMARNELIAKSISRLSFERTLEETAFNKSQAKTTRGITAGKRYENYTNTEMDLIELSIRKYKSYAKHIYIHEGVGDIGVKEIREIVKRHIEITGNKPIVLIDYLQILAPYDVRATDKQNTDKAVLELKRISRDYKLPVIGISSFNRDNYTAPVNTASFKESGAIEYSADVLIGLQYEGMDYRSGEKDGDRQARIRDLFNSMEAKAREGERQDIQLKVLKNRNGVKGSICYGFYAMFNCFREMKDTSAPAKTETDIFKQIKAR